MKAKTVKLEIVKRGRIYYHCLENGYKARLKVNEHSEKLEVGKNHLLLVNDLSIKTKWGTDRVYELSRGGQEKASVITLKFKYNEHIIEFCKQYGGRFDPETKAWMFSDIVKDEVEKLDEYINHNLVTVELTASDKCFKKISEDNQVFTFCGYSMFYFNKYEDTLSLSEGVAIIEGDLQRFRRDGDLYLGATELSRFRIKVSKILFDSYLKEEKKCWMVVEHY
jgi:hypothetical protein